MSDTWITIIALTLLTALLKASGPVLLGGRDLPPRLRPVVALLAAPLLAALVITQTVSDAEGFVIDERLAGVSAAAAVLAWRREAILAAVAVAAAVTAAARAL